MPITLSSPVLRGPTPVDPARAGVLRGAGSRKDARQNRLDWGGVSNLLVGTRFLLKPVFFY